MSFEEEPAGQKLPLLRKQQKWVVESSRQWKGQHGLGGDCTGQGLWLQQWGGGLGLGTG